MMKPLVFFVTSILLTGRCQKEDGNSAKVDRLLEDSGYPKPGDIPLLNRKRSLSKINSKRLESLSCHSLKIPVFGVAYNIVHFSNSDSPQIFKGQRVSIAEHPYVVSIRRQCTHYVVGSLLTRNLVISVAHAVAGVPTFELGVVVGESYADRGAAVWTVLIVLLHEHFDPFTLQADIAMLRLYEDIKYKNCVKPIGLMNPHANVTGKAFVTGWGRCDSTGMELCLFRSSRFFPDERFDPMLRSISFEMTSSNFYCEGYQRHEVKVQPGMLCTGPARGEDPVCPCLGVPGAPLVVNGRLVGILSWGFGCGYGHDLPLIYTSAQNYSGWILHNIIIFRKISSQNLTDIFEATNAYLLVKWLLETRVVTPTLSIRTDKNIEPLKVDKDLMKLRGTVYDVRDFINDGYFHEEKKNIYEHLKNEALSLEKMKNIKNSVENVSSVAFLSKDSLDDSNEIVNTSYDY